MSLYPPNITGALALLQASLLFSACSASAPNAGFLEEAHLLQAHPSKPFDGYWIASAVDLRSYKKIYIAPINTSYLLQMSWWQKLEIATKTKNANPEAVAPLLAGLWRGHLIAAFQGKKGAGYQILETPDDQTLVIQLALTKIVPTKVWLNTLSYPLIGGVDTGLTAMEGRFRAGPNGETIVRIKDAKKGRFALVSIADLQWYSHSKKTLNDWANEIVDVCSKPPEAHISSRLPFTLKPW